MAALRRVSFFIGGAPESRASASAFYRPGLGVRIYRKQKPWEEHASLVCQERAEKPLLSGPVALSLDFRFPRLAAAPKTLEVPHTVKPDLDNCMKSIADALQGRVIERDQQIICALVTKRYCRRGELPGVQVAILELPSRLPIDSCHSEQAVLALLGDESVAETSAVVRELAVARTRPAPQSGSGEGDLGGDVSGLGGNRESG